MITGVFSKYLVNDFSITNLATTTFLTAVENKIPNVINLNKKPDYDAKISDTDQNYFTTFCYNKFTNKILDVKIKNKFLVN